MHNIAVASLFDDDAIDDEVHDPVVDQVEGKASPSAASLQVKRPDDEPEKGGVNRKEKPETTM